MSTIALIVESETKEYETLLKRVRRLNLKDGKILQVVGHYIVNLKAIAVDEDNWSGNR